MKLRTSFSELTMSRKNIFRFAPIWVIYTVLTTMILTRGTALMGTYDRIARYGLANWFTGFSVVNFLYAGLIAMALYGDLYKTRMCYALHAMPQRREARFLGNVAVALAFSLVPNLLLTLLWMLILQSYWFLALYWLLAATLQFIFFFGAASLAAMLTGNHFAQLVAYGLINFISMLAYGAVYVIYLPRVVGVVANSEAFARLCPVVQMTGYSYFEFTQHRQGNQIFFEYAGLGQGWGYLALVAAIGIGMLALALVLYRKRQLECAGDFLAFAKTKLPACVLLTVCVTIVFTMFGQAFDGQGWVEMLVGVTIGFFGSLMLLERRVKVFRKTSWMGYAMLVAVMVVSMLAMQGDWLGIESWLPKAERVESVTLSNGTVNNYYDPTDYKSVTLTDPEDIQQVILAHGDILDRLDEDFTQTHRVTLQYQLSSGRTVIRSYRAPAHGENYRIIMDFFYTKQVMLGFQHWSELTGRLETMYCNYGEVPSHLWLKLLQAAEQDFDAGKLRVSYDSKYYMEYGFIRSDGTFQYRTLHFSEQATHLMAVLFSPEMQMNYNSWETFLGQVFTLNVNGMTIPKEERAGLLEAIRADIEAGNLLAENFGEKYVYTVEYGVSRPNEPTMYKTFFIGQNASNCIRWYADNMRFIMGTADYQMGFTDLEKFLTQLTYLQVDGNAVPLEQCRPLLEAMRQDVENGTLSYQHDGQAGKCDIIYEWIDENGKRQKRTFRVYERAENTLAWLYAGIG